MNLCVSRTAQIWVPLETDDRTQNAQDMNSLSSVSLAVNAPWACLSDGLPSLGQEGGFMSYDQPSVPDFLEHYDGIPEVVLGGACNAPQRARKS